MDDDYRSLWVFCDSPICKECRMSEYRRKLPFLVAMGLCFAFCPDTASAREPEPLPVEIALRSHSFGEISPLAVSPGGKWIAYSVHDNLRMQAKREQGIEKERYVRSGILLQNEANDIWITNLEGGNSRNLTEGLGSNWNPAWSPDGHYLAFLSDRDGSGQARLWIWDSQQDHLRRTSTVNVRSPYPAPGIQWLPDSHAVVLAIIPEHLSLEDYVRQVTSPDNTTASATESHSGAGVILYSSLRAASPDPGVARSSRMNLDAFSFSDLALIDVASGAVKSISHGERIGWYSPSTDGSQIAYAVPKHLHAVGTFRKIYDLVSRDMSNGSERTIASDALLGEAFGWSPHGLDLVYGVYDSSGDGMEWFAAPASGGEARRLATLPHATPPYSMPAWDPAGRYFFLAIDGALWRVSVSGDQPMQIAHIPERRIVRRVARPGPQLWSSDEGHSTVVLARDRDGKQDGFYRVDLESGKSTLLAEDGRCFDCNVLGSGMGLNMIAASPKYLAYVAEDAQHAPDVWVSDARFEHARQVTHLNPQMENYKMCSSRLVDWLSDDGKRLHGALLLPSDFHAGTQYPLVVYVYPTLLSRDYDQFGFGGFPGPLNLQLLATRGYAVLLPDFEEHTNDGIAAFAKSVLPGVTKVVELGIADPERIGVMGHSAGGYEALGLLTTTRRFKAGVALAGFGDYASLYGQLDRDGAAWAADETEQELGALPWQQPFDYIEKSPFYYLDRIETPLLIVHGSKDGAVSSFLTDQMFVGMRRLGKEVEYAKYLGEGHVPRDWNYVDQLDVANRIIEWFERHLR
jgi:dipeptidyl aminopeptidase/acylaminoacyl peptidase